MVVVNTHEAKTNLSRLLDEVLEGQDIVIARGNKPLARLVPYTGGKCARKPGVLKGRIKVSEDFDTPLSDEIVASFEAGA